MQRWQKCTLAVCAACAILGGPAWAAVALTVAGGIGFSLIVNSLLQQIEDDNDGEETTE